MKILLALCFVLINFDCFTQKTVPHYYRLDELHSAHSDTVYYLTLSREKRDSIPSSLYRFTKLKGLDLSKNKLTDIPLNFQVFSELEYLNVSHNKLKFLPVSLTKLPLLKVLIAASNSIGSLPDQMEDLDNLKKIDLYDNEISDFGAGFYKLHQLEEIDIRGTMYGTKLHKEIRSKFPKSKVAIDPPCKCMD